MKRHVFLIAIAASLFLAGLCFGRTLLGFADLWEVFWHKQNAEAWFLVYELRLPRLCTAAGAGIALGLSGAICQSLFRNPLAAPEMLGVTTGASLGAVALVLSGVQGTLLSIGAASGAILTVLLLLVLAGPRPPVIRLILTGVGISLTTGAITGLLLSRADDALAGDAMLWLTGSLNGRYWPHARFIWIALVPLIFMTALGKRALDQMELGDDLAQSSGIAVRRARPFLILIVAMLTAAAVAIVGPIGFVGLMAGPIARHLRGNGTPNLAGAAIIGAIIMLLADLMSTLMAPIVLVPAGIFTGLLGAPWLIWLLWHGDMERERR